MLKDRYIFCYKNVRMRTTKNLCMRKFRNLNFRNRHVPKHWHTNFHEIPRDSWIFSLYVGKFHHLSATCRLMIVMNLAQIVIFYLHKSEQIWTTKSVTFCPDTICEVWYIYIYIYIYRICEIVHTVIQTIKKNLICIN